MTNTEGDAKPKRASPFQGLIPFDEADSSFFFGREREIRLITANLFAAPLTLLYGSSGVGKSSVLSAGVVPQLRKEKDIIVVAFKAWKVEPIRFLIEKILEACPNVSIPQSSSLADCIAACSKQFDRQLIIILDQFEEYFTYHVQDDELNLFTFEISQAITQPDVPVSFLISIREDSLAKLDLFEGHIPTLFDNYLRLEHLDKRAATDAILKPVERFNQLQSEYSYVVEPQLIEPIIEQVKTGRINIGHSINDQIALRRSSDQSKNIYVETPYLQLVLMRLWDEETTRNSQILRLSTFSSLGGAEQITRTHLDTTMKYLSPDEQEISAHILSYLVTSSGSKIALSVDTLEEFTKIPDWRIQATVKHLTDPKLRILSPISSGSPDRTETWYEIFHDALAPAVLEWQSRYFRKQSLPERIIRPAVYFAIGALITQTIPNLSFFPSLLFTLRFLAFLIFHTAAFFQVYQWFYQQVRPKLTRIRFSVLETKNLGLMLGFLLSFLWFTSTDWSYGDLGSLTSQEYLSYLFTLVLTLVFALVTLFVIGQGAGQITYKRNKHFEIGFFGSYFCICIVVAILTLLYLGNAFHPWIAF